MKKKEERKEVLKTKHRKKKKKTTTGNLRVTQNGALNPPLRTRHMATTFLVSPLRIECREKP